MGKHRLFAHLGAGLKTEVIVSAFKGASLKQQGEIFLGINKNQKPVPTELVWDLIGGFDPNSVEGRISNAVKQMNLKGPLRNKIYFPSLGMKKNFKDCLKISGFCNSLKKAGFGKKSRDPFYEKNCEKHSDELKSKISSYHESIKELFQEDWERGAKGFVLSNGGSSIMIGLLEVITNFAKKKNLDIDTELYNKILKSARKYLNMHLESAEGLSKLKKTNLTSGSARGAFLDELCLSIKEDLNESDFGKDIEKN